jgi:hypothetical protein
VFILDISKEIYIFFANFRLCHVLLNPGCRTLESVAQGNMNGSCPYNDVFNPILYKKKIRND